MVFRLVTMLDFAFFSKVALIWKYEHIVLPTLLMRRVIQKNEFTIQKEVLKDCNTIQKGEFTIQKNEFTIQKSDFTIQKKDLKDSDTIQKKLVSFHEEGKFQTTATTVKIAKMTENSRINDLIRLKMSAKTTTNDHKMTENNLKCCSL